MSHMKKILSILSVIMLLFASQAYAQELKVGIIDMNQILQKAPLMVSLNKDLLKKFQPRQDELNTAQKQLQDEVNKLNINGPTMSASDRTTLQNKIINDKANVQILDASLARDLALAKDQALQQFMTKLNDVVSKVAQEGHYDLIQQSTGFAYINSKLDITQEILQRVS